MNKDGGYVLYDWQLRCVFLSTDTQIRLLKQSGKCLNHRISLSINSSKSSLYHSEGTGLKDFTLQAQGSPESIAS